MALHHYFLDYAEERVNIDKNEVHFQTVFSVSCRHLSFLSSQCLLCLKKDSINFFHAPNLNS